MDLRGPLRRREGVGMGKGRGRKNRESVGKEKGDTGWERTWDRTGREGTGGRGGQGLQPPPPTSIPGATTECNTVTNSKHDVKIVFIEVSSKILIIHKKLS